MVMPQPDASSTPEDDERLASVVGDEPDPEAATAHRDDDPGGPPGADDATDSEQPTS
ncbi:MAG TPA: hypothetical protein VHK88_16660 [Aquihabitans sp.]|jgi:hypothetical protein|nr:hypothetical protein [Aquihabitans sp.]